MDDHETIAALGELGAATLGESGALPMPGRIRPVWPGASVAAPAFPVTCTPGDNLAVHVAVAAAPAGAVLVVDVGDVPDRGYWGEVLTTAAQARGLAGLVIDGCVRDVAALERLAFPVFSRGWPYRVPPRTTRAAPDRRPPSPACRWRAATGWSATSTGWSWSGVPPSVRRSPPVGPGLRVRRSTSPPSGREPRPSSSCISTPR